MCAAVDPRHKIVNFTFCQTTFFLFRWHRRDAVCMFYGAYYQTLLRLPGDNGRTAVATVLPASSSIQCESTAGLARFGRMARNTVIQQQRTDPRFKEFVGRLSHHEMGIADQNDRA